MVQNNSTPYEVDLNSWNLQCGQVLILTDGIDASFWN